MPLAGGQMCCWHHMEPQILQLSTIRLLQLFQAGPCNAWRGWMALFKMLLQLAIPLCCMALHLVLLQQDESVGIRWRVVTAALIQNDASAI